MPRIRDRIGFLRGGLFTKYVASLVGLVIVVLAVNGAVEIWFSYRSTRAAITETMSNRAQSIAQRVGQSVSDLERQINWVTRASVTTLEQRRADYAQLMSQVRAISQLSQIDGAGREQVRLTRSTISLGSNADLSRDTRFTEGLRGGVYFAPVIFRDGKPLLSIAVAHSAREVGVTIAEIDLGFLSEFVEEVSEGKSASAYIADRKGRVVATSTPTIRVGQDVSQLPQVTALIGGGGGPSSGIDMQGRAVLTAAREVPKLDWLVIVEQAEAQAFVPIRDQLVRIALFLVLGLGVAMLAGMLLARRMLIPIRALHAGARRLGEGDFNHQLDVRTSDEFEELADQFNGMAGQLRETYAGLESKVEARTRDLARSVNELKVLEEVGRAVASSLDLKAVLPTIAERAQGITRADAVMIYGYDAVRHFFNCIEASGLGAVETARAPEIAQDGSVLGDAAARGEPVAVSDIAMATTDSALKEVAITAGFRSLLVVPLADNSGVLGALIVLRKEVGDFPANLTELMQTFAHQAVLAMRNARLFHEVDQKGRELALAHDTVQRQASKLQEQTAQLLDWNHSLEERVAKQLGEIERIRKLERFLAPQVAQLIASSDGHESLLNSHRREVTVVFCDLRGFTAFTENSEPEEAMNVLREYHAALGELIFRYEGTLDRFAGDGVMILFNAPIPFADHVQRAVKMAVEMRERIGSLTEQWRNRGHHLGFGVGIAVGYATLGQVGFEQRLEYAAIGSVTNLASRLCDEAQAGQIIISQRAYSMVQSWAQARPVGELSLKGFHHAVAAVEILGWTEETSASPARAAS